MCIRDRSAGGAVGGGRVSKIIFTGTIAVAGYAQIARIAKVNTKLYRVIADRLGPVIDQLELVFLFNERAVAVIHIQAGAELGAAVLNSRGITRSRCGHVGDGDIRRSVVRSNYLARHGTTHVLPEERQVCIPGIVFICLLYTSYAMSRTVEAMEEKRRIDP